MRITSSTLHAWLFSSALAALAGCPIEPGDLGDLTTGGEQNDAPACGDGLVQPGEQCDDGNHTDGDGCSAKCTLEKLLVCGDGVVEPGEQCDDGNLLDGDGCSGNCTLEGLLVCGDGIVQPGEQCDDGNAVNTDLCTTACKLAACGDGFVQKQAGEQCDDGNVVNGDGCSAQCKLE